MSDLHPPLDFLVARLVEALEPADWARKLPAVFWGSATVPVLGLLLTRRAGVSAGLFAATLLAFAPFHVRYSQEFRPYALGLFLLCLSLLFLECFLDGPSISRLLALYLACLATAYALYLAALVLGLAALALLVEDCFDPKPERRRTTRLFLLGSPLFGAAIFVGYLPWWPVLREAARRPPMAPRAAFTLERLDRFLSFFLFAPDGEHPLRLPGALFLGLSLAGEPEYPAVRAWAKPLPVTAYPTAEGALLVKLDPALRNAVLPQVASHP